MITTATTTLPPYLSNPAGTKACNFLNHIDKYTITDITLLEEIAIKSENQDQERGANHYLFGTGRCSTALSSLCFSAIEQIGMLIRGDLTSANMRDVLK